FAGRESRCLIPCPVCQTTSAVHSLEEDYQKWGVCSVEEEIKPVLEDSKLESLILEYLRGKLTRQQYEYHYDVLLQFNAQESMLAKDSMINFQFDPSKIEIDPVIFKNLSADLGKVVTRDNSAMAAVDSFWRTEKRRLSEKLREENQYESDFTFRACFNCSVEGAGLFSQRLAAFECGHVFCEECVREADDLAFEEEGRTACPKCGISTGFVPIVEMEKKIVKKEEVKEEDEL
ncbi:hypothetical protein PMAYCL1PPCAC_22147, partial [Pristionchus mayeri]